MIKEGIDVWEEFCSRLERDSSLGDKPLILELKKIIEELESENLKRTTVKPVVAN